MDKNSPTPNVLISSDVRRGGFYNAFTASAGEVTATFLSQGGSTGKDVSRSICARGWKFPNKQDASFLVSKYSFSAFSRSPASFNYGEYYYVGSGQGDQEDLIQTSNASYGHTMWAGTFGYSGNFSSDCGRGYNIPIDASTPSLYPCVGYGLTMRCIAK